MTHIITGKNLDLGSALITHIEDALSKLEKKYQLSSLSAHVVFEKSPHHKFHAHMTLPLDKTHVFKADGDDVDIYQATRLLLERLESAIRKHKERLDDHHKHHDNHKFITKDLISA